MHTIYIAVSHEGVLYICCFITLLIVFANNTLCTSSLQWFLNIMLLFAIITLVALNSIYFPFISISLFACMNGNLKSKHIRTRKLFQMMLTFNINFVDLHKSFLPFIPRIPVQIPNSHSTLSIETISMVITTIFVCLRSNLLLPCIDDGCKWQTTISNENVHLHTSIQIISNKKWAFWIFWGIFDVQQNPIPDPGSWSAVIYGKRMAKE